MYEHLENETKRKFAITFWKTVDNKFGARAGTAESVMGYETPELAIAAAIEAMVEWEKYRNSKNDQNSSANNPAKPG